MTGRWLLLGIVVLTLASPPYAVADSAVGKGDFDFFLDAAAFRASDGSPLEEVYLRVSNAQLRFRQANGTYEARARVFIRIRDEARKAVVNDRTDWKMYADTDAETGSAVMFHTLIKKYRLAPGRYTLSCVVQDLNSPKMTVLGMVKHKVKEARVDGQPIETPDFARGGMTVSDAEFLWDAGGTRSGARYRPNPPRLYGLYRDSLRVYFEAYVPRRLALAAPQVETVILNEAGEVVAQSTSPLPQARPGEPSDSKLTYPVVVTEDLNRFPAGAYTLYINAGLSDQLLLRVRAGKFSVAWDLRTWEVSRRTYLAEARFLLRDEDFAAFTAKSLGEQETMLKEMWKEVDPDPTTGVNEAYEEFLQRLAYVNANYTDYQLGIFTDRGLVYLKYGPPEDRIVDVIPLNRESVADAMEKVRDRFHVVSFSTSGGRVGFATSGRDIIVDPRRLGAVGEGGEVAFPYELWVYAGQGDPILERDRVLEPDIGLRFIFVDREGYGRYKLESSSSLGDK